MFSFFYWPLHTVIEPVHTHRRTRFDLFLVSTPPVNDAFGVAGYWPYGRGRLDYSSQRGGRRRVNQNKIKDEKEKRRIYILM